MNTLKAKALKLLKYRHMAKVTSRTVNQGDILALEVRRYKAGSNKYIIVPLKLDSNGAYVQATHGESFKDDLALMQGWAEIQRQWG